MKTFHEWLLETHWSDESEWPDEEESESEHTEKLMVVDLVKRLLKAERGRLDVGGSEHESHTLDKAIQKAANELNMDIDDVSDMWWDVTGPKPFGKSWHDIHPDHRRDKDLSYPDPVTSTFRKDDFENSFENSKV